MEELSKIESQSDFSLRLTQWLLDHFCSLDALDTVTGQLVALISRAQQDTVMDIMCADIARLMFRKATQNATNMQLYTRLSYSLFLGIRTHKSRIGSRSDYVHEHLFRLCIRTLDSGNSLPRSNSGASCRIQPPCMNRERLLASPHLDNVPVQRITLLVSDLHSFGLISVVQIYEYLKQLTTSLTPVEGRLIGFCTLVEAHGSKLNTGLWKCETEDILKWAIDSSACGVNEWVAAKVKSVVVLLSEIEMRSMKIEVKEDGDSKPQSVAALPNRTSHNYPRLCVEAYTSVPTQRDGQNRVGILPPTANPAQRPSSNTEAAGGGSNCVRSTHTSRPRLFARATAISNGASPEPIVPLDHERNGSALRGCPATLLVEWRTQVTCRVRELLDMLRTEDFESIAIRMISCADECQQEDDGFTLRQITKLIIDKAIGDEKYSRLYALLCSRMKEGITSGVQDKTCPSVSGHAPVGGMVFFRYLVEWFKEDFERGRMFEAASSQFLSHADRRSYDSKVKRQYLGSLRFDGELFNARLLSDKVGLMCVRTLFSRVALGELHFEGLCKFLTTAGQRLDHCDSAVKGRMDEYFNRLQGLAKINNVSQNIRTMLRDLIDLRARQWRTHSQCTDPMLCESSRG